MLEAQIDILNNGHIHKVFITKNKKQLYYNEVLSLWQDSEGFRSFFISILSEAPFSAYRWETPPITTSTVDCVFEFVLLDSPSLARSPDKNAFASYFDTANEKGIATFFNLGKDAFLVVPSPLGAASSYGHLAMFTREAPKTQNHALWQIVGETVQKRLSDRPIWLNTAGGGVSWLHVRLDSYPKYYGYSPYKHVGKSFCE